MNHTTSSATDPQHQKEGVARPGPAILACSYDITLLHGSSGLLYQRVVDVPLSDANRRVQSVCDMFIKAINTTSMYTDNKN